MNGFISSPVFLWLAAAAVLLIAEACTTGLVCVWFAIGAAAAMLATWLLKIGPLAQFGVFVVVSAIALAVMRPLSRKMRESADSALPTSVAANMGRTCTARTEIGVQTTGRVTLDGVDWNARSLTGGSIPADTLCVVEGMEHTVLLVRPAADTTERSDTPL